MYIHNRLENKNNFFRKFRNLDIILLVCIFLLGFISFATMYSTDGGEILFHTKSHATKFFIFVILMLSISFLNIRLWFSVGYLAYIIGIIMLVWTVNFGMKASFVQKSLDWGDAVWGDQIDPALGPVNPTSQPQGNNALYADFNSGILLFGKNLFLISVTNASSIGSSSDKTEKSDLNLLPPAFIPKDNL